LIERVAELRHDDELQQDNADGHGWQRSILGIGAAASPGSPKKNRANLPQRPL
jgi:hypothetical protein